MRRPYGDRKNLGAKKRDQIETANQIIAEYQAQGLNLTLRQLYYQFVARGLIENSDRSYKNLGQALNDGRMAGLIDWTAIEDRTRNLRGNPHWSHPADVIDSAAASFRYDLWRDQPNRVEVWIEKDALLGVIEQICRQLDVPYFSCRGYVSASEMWTAARRHGRHLSRDQAVTILHLGDHDPSGMQMTEDIEHRLSTFTWGDLVMEAFDDLADREEVERYCTARDEGGLAVPTVNRIALTMDQVNQYNPPPNPAKLSDSRAGGYIAQWGRSSWELDALNPTTLRDLIQGEVEALRDDDLWNAAVGRQEAARDRLEELASQTRDEWVDDE